jgi:triosephosphate isomerase
MRTPIIAGNWKMYKPLRESVDFVRELMPKIAPYSNVERVVCPTFIALSSVATVLDGTRIKVGAQNIHWKKDGAYTSQIAPPMLQGLVEYVIIGHSEVRAYLAETDENVNLKARAALEHGIKPIIAIGESREQREANQTDAVVGGQLRAALMDIAPEQITPIVIAYEPIWAIGTGLNCEPAEAQRVCGDVIRGTLRELYGAAADDIRIQYGGSVKPDNMQAYMSQPDIDGALVGGASLKVDDFTRLIEIASVVKGT